MEVELSQSNKTIKRKFMQMGKRRDKLSLFSLFADGTDFFFKRKPQNGFSNIKISQRQVTKN